MPSIDDLVTVAEAFEKSKSGHPGGSLSAADIVATLFFSGVMKYNHNNPEDHTEDRFFLSKGHVAPVLYAAYHLLDWLHDEDMVTLRQLGSRLQGHPDCHACPGIEVCSGSLGQGLSVAAGCALGLSMDALASGERAKKVFVLLGDGELQEGSNWEACMFAAHQKLDNLIAIVDLNNLQIDGHVTDVCSLGDIDEKFRSFGWNVLRVNGHEVTEVRGVSCLATISCGEKGLAHLGDLVTVNAQHVPAKRTELLVNIAKRAHVCDVAVNLQVIEVHNGNKVIQLLVSSKLIVHQRCFGW